MVDRFSRRQYNSEHDNISQQNNEEAYPLEDRRQFLPSAILRVARRLNVVLALLGVPLALEYVESEQRPDLTAQHECRTRDDPCGCGYAHVPQFSQQAREN